MELKWPPWTGKPQRPVEPSGDPHNCPKYSGGGRKSNSWDMGDPLDTTIKPIISYCGKCCTLCVEDDNRGQWCEKCGMYPQVTFSSDNFEPNPMVKALQTSNKSEVLEEYRGKNDDAPTNWMHMKVDGAMTDGYPLTSELTKWYENQGESVLEEMNSKIIFKKKIKSIQNKL